MAREPQRREQAVPLGAAIVPVERALVARAKAIEEAYDDGTVRDVSTQADVMRAVAAEFRALADELHHW